MGRGMASLVRHPSIVSAITLPKVCSTSLKLLKSSNVLQSRSSSRVSAKKFLVRCTSMTPWEPQPVKYASTDEASDNFLNKSASIFETLGSANLTEATKIKQLDESVNQPILQRLLFKWPMWLLGPVILLTTGMVPTLWLPISSVFIGPNAASLLALTGLDCIFNLGAALFLLMADSCARPNNTKESCNSKPPLSYQFWNMVASVAGFITPLIMLLGTQKGILQPQLPLISFAVLLGPYLLLLSVQMLTEMLTWHWQSPVWLVTPIVYGAYRVLQLMRGLKLGAELTAPIWMMNTVRGLVLWSVLILGVQLMSVAWFAGFTARSQQQQPIPTAES